MLHEIKENTLEMNKVGNLNRETEVIKKKKETNRS